MEKILELIKFGKHQILGTLESAITLQARDCKGITCNQETNAVMVCFGGINEQHLLSGKVSHKGKTEGIHHGCEGGVQSIDGN